MLPDFILGRYLFVRPVFCGVRLIVRTYMEQRTPPLPPFFRGIRKKNEIQIGLFRRAEIRCTENLVVIASERTKISVTAGQAGFELYSFRQSFRQMPESRFRIRFVRAVSAEHLPLPFRLHGYLFYIIQTVILSAGIFNIF